MEEGKFGDVKPVGEGVSEMRIDYGPGYRAYFIKRERTVILLLCGGDKKTQARDIAKAKKLARERVRSNGRWRFKTAPFDAAEVLDTEEAIEEYIAAAFETEDPAFIAKALGTVARARNMSKLAREDGHKPAGALSCAERQGQPGVRNYHQGDACARAQAGASAGASWSFGLRCGGPG